jgi:hypothetical protein
MQMYEKKREERVNVSSVSFDWQSLEYPHRIELRNPSAKTWDMQEQPTRTTSLQVHSLALVEGIFNVANSRRPGKQHCDLAQTRPRPLLHQFQLQGCTWTP